MKATRTKIATARADVELANSEINRWGMMLAALTEGRESLRRGVEDDTVDEVTDYVRRIVEGRPETTVGQRRTDLAYLDARTTTDGPAAGKTFFQFATSQSGMGSFPGRFESFVTGGGPSPSDVVSAFEQDALGPALSNYDADPGKLDALVDLAEAGVRAAKAERRAAIERLNNEFDEDGNQVSTGLLESFHEPERDDDGSVGLGDLAAAAETDELRAYRDLVGSMDELPAVLLPVGLETRFVESSDDRTGPNDQLWVRVYPDDIHVDAHEAELTPQEERWGKTFWTQVYVARFPVAGSGNQSPKDRFYVPPEQKLPSDPVVRDQLSRLFYDTGAGTTLSDFSADVASRYREVKERAWGLLVERLGRERASHVARQLAPVDKSDADEPETAVSVLSGPIEESTGGESAVRKRVSAAASLEFPSVEYRPGSWTKQPRARFLPDRWLAFVEWTAPDGSERTRAVAAPFVVREPLFMGPNPESVATAKHDGSTDGDDGGDDAPDSTMEAVDDGMEWMVDFEEAEQAGMALRVTCADLGTDSLPSSFDRVSVVGLKSSMDESETGERLRELLDVHEHTRGLEILPPGTPTNNHDEESGYRANEDHLDTLDTDVGAPLTAPSEPTDANVLSSVLGIERDDGESHPFAHVGGADRTDWFDAYHMQSVLWPGTLGHFLKHALVPGKYRSHEASDAELEAETELLSGIREHFVQYVRGTGPLPTLRVGEQPYGVLPATSLEDHERPSDVDPVDATYWFLLQATKWLRKFWEGSLHNVNRIDPDRAAGQIASSSLYGNLDYQPILSAVEATGDDGENDDDGGTDGKQLEREGEPHASDESTVDGRSLIERVLEQDALSNTYKHRPYMLEYQREQGYRQEPEYQALSQLGIDFDPRIGRFFQMDVTADRKRYPYYDMVAGRSDLDPVAGVVSQSETYLDELSRASTGDLVRLGFDYSTRRFESMFADVYTQAGSVNTWTPLAELFDDIRSELSQWARSGEKSSAATRLASLFDADVSLFPGDLYVDGYGFDVDAASHIVVEHILGSAHEETAANLRIIQLLFVDALDDWLGEQPPSESGREITLSSGETLSINTTGQDGHEFLLTDLEDVQYAIRLDLRKAIADESESWPAGTEKLQELYQAIDASLLYGAMGTTKTMSGDVENDRVNAAGDAYDESGDEEAWDAMLELVQHHTVEYLTLAFPFKQTPADSRKEVWDSFREPGAGAIPTGDDVSLATKTDRDTSLFDLVTWYATMNANLNVIHRNAESPLDANDFVIGDQGDYGENTAYELLDESSPRTVREALGWSGGYDQHHEIATEFAGQRWFGMLDAMRSEKYIDHDGTDERFKSFQASLRWMAEEGWLSSDRTDQTERLFASTLDVSSHRLDAWWTAFATRRLSEIRSDDDGELLDVDVADAWTDTATEEETSGYHPNQSNHEYALDTDSASLPDPDGDDGTYLGAYGFVENLEKEDGYSEKEYEYLQAHSVNHGRAAAILRSGYRSNPDEEFRETLQVDLSPERVRKAQSILEGLREGLWLGEILGYYFERRLHEMSEADSQVEIQEYIADFRAYKPLSAGKIDRDTSGRSDPAAKANVVDGYALYDAVADHGKSYVFGKVGVDRNHDAFTTVFEELAEMVDSVADLLTAENVYQLQQGNYTQAGRSVASLAEGKVPRNLEIARTQRDSVGVTHRLLSLTGLGDGGDGEDLSTPSSWQATGTVDSPKLDADGKVSLNSEGTPETTSEGFVVRDEGAPVVNDLAGRLFPDPKTVQCAASYRFTTETADGTETEHEVATSVTLADLRLSPVDALYLTQQTGDAGASKLESHVAYYLMRNRPDVDPAVPNDATVAVSFGELPDAAPDTALSFGDFVELSRSVRDLVSEGRPADATDLAHPGDVADPGHDHEPLRKRADRSKTTLEDVEAVLANRLSAFGSSDVDEDGGGQWDDTSTFAGVDDSNDDQSSENDGNAAGGNGDDNGESDSSEKDGAASGFADRTASVQEIQDALDEFASAGHLSSAETTVDGLSGSEFLTELQTVEKRLPAGPTEASDVERELAVEATVETIRGRIEPAAPSVDFGMPPETVLLRGTTSGQNPKVLVRDWTGEVVAEPQVGQNGDEFRAEVDFGDILMHPDSLGVGRIEVKGTESTITGFDGDETPDGGPYGRSVRVAVGPQSILAAIEDGSVTVSVDVESQSPATRFSTSKSGVPVEDDATYAADVDFSAATPGTPFELVVTAHSESDAAVVETRDGRVVGDPPNGGVDDSFVSGLSTIPRLLWLDAHAGAYAPLALTGTDGVDLDGVLADRRRFAPSHTSGLESAQVRKSGASTERMSTSFDAGGGSMDETTTSGDSVDAGTVRDLADTRGNDSGPSGGDVVPDVGPDRASVAARFSTPAGRLVLAIRDADWTALEREFALMPSSRTTFDTAERTAVENLLALPGVDLAGVSRALTGVDRTRGVVTTARKLGLTKAINTVGTDAPFGTDEQTYYAATDPSVLAEAKGRIRAFQRDEMPSDTRWRSDELLLVDGDLVEFVADRDLEGEFATLLAAVSDPNWNARTLSTVTDEPQKLIRGVDDLLYHPESLESGEHATVAQRLSDVARAANAAVREPRVRDRLQQFEHVAEVDDDFGRPLSTLAGALASFDPPADAGTARSTFVQSFDDAVDTLRSNLTPLQTASAGLDFADAFREGLLETLRLAMVRAAYFGVYGAMPAEASGDSQTDARNLVRQAEDVLGAVRDRLGEVQSVETADPVDEQIERLRALFGEQLQVMPPFEPTNPGELQRSFGDDTVLDHDDAGPLPVETWFGRSARVREKPAMLRETLTYADSVTDVDHRSLGVSQLPYYPGDDWVGVDGVRPNVGDRVSVVAHTDDGFENMVSNGMGSNPRVAGVFVDEWIEEFPSESETTAVSFRYDDPNNRPPQSILVATPPRTSDDETPWSLSTLQRTIGETLDMTKNRAVDLEALKPSDDTERIAIGHLLPALLFANDTHVQANHPTMDFTVLEQVGEYYEQAIAWNMQKNLAESEAVNTTRTVTDLNLEDDGDDA